MAAIAEKHPEPAAASSGCTVHLLSSVELRKPRPPQGYLSDPEQARVLETCERLAGIEAQQLETDDKARDCRASTEREMRVQLPALADRAEALKDEHARARGNARLAILAALDASSQRAGLRYRAACDMVADAAAELEGLARFRDELLNQPGFDGLGIWQRANSLLAPPLHLRPKGAAVALDASMRECYWSASSPAHLEAVRRTQQAFRAELEPTLAGARWPF